MPPPARLARRGGDAFRRRQVGLLEPRERHDRVVARHALDRREQRQQAAVGDARGDLRADADVARGLVGDHAAAGLADGLENRVDVERRDRRDVDDFGLDAFVGERRRGRERLARRRAPGHERHVLAFAQHEADVERQRVARVGHLFLREAIEPRRLEKHHRIGIADGREQQAVGARRRGGNHDAQARNVREQRLRAFGVVLGRMDAAAHRRAQHERAREPAAGAVAQARGVIQQLVDRGIDEAHELDLGDGPQALRREPDAHAGDQRFRERRVDDALGAEALEQALRWRGTRRR